MAERRRGLEVHTYKPPQNTMHRGGDILLPQTRPPYVTNGLHIPTWSMLPKGGATPKDYADSFPRNTSRATIALGAAGFGCQPYRRNDGETINYFSWLYDELNTVLSLPYPLLMDTFAFPGTMWDQSARNKDHLSRGLGPYSIKHHPEILSQVIDDWIREARQRLPESVQELDAMVIAHSYAGRALATHLSQIMDNNGGGKARLGAHLRGLAERNGFDKVQIMPIFLAPAFEIHEDARKLVPLAAPLRAMDDLIRRFPAGGSVYKRYHEMTRNPFQSITKVVIDDRRLARMLIGDDGCGFMHGFPTANDPHILLHHAAELASERATLSWTLNETLRDARWDHLVLSGAQDRLVANSRIDDVFGPPGHFSTEDDLIHHIRLSGMTHIDCLQDPGKVAQTIADHYRLSRLQR